MTKFKNKKTGAVVEETLNFYIEKLRNNPNFEEVKEAPKKNNKKEEVENTPQ